MSKTCKTCGFLDPKQQGCKPLHIYVNPDKDCCPKYKYYTLIQPCESCGNTIIGNITFAPDGDKYHILCESCAEQLTSCNFCKNGNECDFETNPSTLPKMIQQRIQQGPMISVMTVKNPSRIDITCKAGCPCYDPDFECMKQFNFCEKIDHIYKEQVPNDTGGPEDE